jgi:uncharacterized protein Smg (DUF494 family)
MQEKIIEIIAFLMAELSTNQPFSENTFKDLSNQGYTDTEISAAFSWIADKSTLQERTGSMWEAGKHSFRILHSFEKAYISKEVYGYLMQLAQLGILDHEQMETVIERCLVSGMQPVDMTTAKFAVGSLLVDGLNAPGQRLFLNGTETIH